MTTTNYNSAEAVRYLRDACAAFINGEISSILRPDEALEARYPGMPRSQMEYVLHAAMDDLEDRIEEAHRAYDQELAFVEQAIGLLIDMPEGTTLGEAVRLKTSRGDPKALKFVADWPDWDKGTITIPE